MFTAVWLSFITLICKTQDSSSKASVTFWLNCLDHVSKAFVLDYAAGAQDLQDKTGNRYSYFFCPFRVC